MSRSVKEKPNPPITGVEHLNLTFWNIHGHRSKLIGNKFSDDEFLNIFRNDHIVGLAELHIDSAPNMPY